jgi:hypothetical protein
MTPRGLERSTHPQVLKEIRQDRITLEPLRILGRDALNIQGLQPIVKIILRELDITWDNEFHQLISTTADDIFNCTTAEGVPFQLIPTYGKLTRADFDIHFANSPEIQTIEIRPPYTIILPPGCDAQVIERWLSQTGFISPHVPLAQTPAPIRSGMGEGPGVRAKERTGSSDAEPVAML